MIINIKKQNIIILKIQHLRIVKKQLNNVWKADDKFINEMERDHEEPMAPIAGKLI